MSALVSPVAANTSAKIGTSISTPPVVRRPDADRRLGEADDGDVGHDGLPSQWWA